MTSVEHYAATLAKWLGVADADLPAVFQYRYTNLADFGGQGTVDFMI